MTTIEFCEKAVSGHKKRATYEQGLYGNIKQVLGPHVMLWPFPVAPPLGDGLNFTFEEESTSDGKDPEWTGESTVLGT